jgi:hypothetical protein
MLATCPAPLVFRYFVIIVIYEVTYFISRGNNIDFVFYRYSVRISSGTSGILTEFFVVVVVFPWSLQTNAEAVSHPMAACFQIRSN